MLGLQPTIGSTLIMPSFVAIIIGGLGSLPGTLLGGLLIGVASGITSVFFPLGLGGRHLRDDGTGIAGPAARSVGRRRAILVRPLTKRGADVVVWLLLLTMPYWINSVGGYTSLGSRVLVLALAAMSLNFLLGFTGVLSFGHAAYFGLGVYGMGLTIKYLIPSTLAGTAIGVSRRGRCCRDWAPDRALARDLFRDGHDRLWPSILFYRLSLEFGHRR